MKLKDLFDRIDELNKIYNEIGLERQYGIKLVALSDIYAFQIFKRVYVDVNELEKAVREETYIKDIGEQEVILSESSRDIMDISWTLKIRMKDVFDNIQTATYFCIFEELEED